MINKDCIYDYFGCIGNRFIEDETIDHNVVSIYTILRTVFYTNNNSSKFNLYDLYNLFDAKSTNQRKPIKDALEFLKENKYIVIYDILCNKCNIDYKNTSESYIVEFINDCSFDDKPFGELHVGGFTKISTINMINIILYLKNNENITFHKYKFIRYYLYISRICSNIDFCGYVSMNKILVKFNINNSTCTMYNKILQDNVKCIYYNNEYGKISSNGSVKNVCTIFGNRNIVNQNNEKITLNSFNENVRLIASENNYILLDKKLMSNKRSDTMKKIWKERKGE